MKLLLQALQTLLLKRCSKRCSSCSKPAQALLSLAAQSISSLYFSLSYGKLS
jgi:hypothetical protein